ncbi:uracil-DNA glycosylase family protein [Echinicola jeungdonensis]|uniref:Uracil-DNA glycosylase family protein n=1 Tax=Echinicola jeungdonensis TaxID=709343 RepID=A0ABV5J2C7_9BACT|nr:uracil-DNA glycosylase family protein [Echinicola jeungdonensis]MDN3668931.1 uracil-DNA glycosylase family protein [Echinicola jeungdonensis]
MEKLLSEIKKCTVCELELPLGANPIVTGSTESKIVVVGQAPGKIVHHTGIPWNDKSGDNLRNWMGLRREEFYDPSLLALVPMGFCFPGKGNSGDLPPRPECAPLWHGQLFAQLKKVELVLLVGNYAQKFYLGKSRKENLTETVHHFESYLPKFFPLPHPSPRNNIWQSKHPWFKETVLPRLKVMVKEALKSS